MFTNHEHRSADEPTPRGGTLPGMPSRRPDMPSDEALVAEVALYGSMAAVDRAHGWPNGTLDQYARRASRTALRATCKAYARAPHEMRDYAHGYPTDDELVGLMREHRSFAAVARSLGRRPESLRGYLSRRPALDARMREHLPPRLTAAERQLAARASSRDYMRRQRLAEPTTTRARRRLSMAGTKPPGSKPALDADLNDYARVLRADPCSYCDGPCEHIDHIVPVAAGGALDWTNVTASCGFCNRRKRTRALLVFLADPLR